MRQRIFFDDRDREKFLEILKRTKKRYRFRLHAYVLMDNHYHLILETPEANLSQTMQNINTSYTVYVNRRRGRSGHLFQGRFKCIIVDKDAYLVTLSRYIHLNPVRAAIVERPEDYRWSSYRYYRESARKESLVDLEDTLSIFSDKKEAAITVYGNFVASGVGNNENPFEDVEGGILLGRSSFKEDVKALLDLQKEDDDMPQLRQLRAKISVDRVMAACCSYYGIGREELLQKRNGKRGVAIYLAKTFSGRKNTDIGRYFGIKGPAVSNMMAMIERRMEREETLNQEVAQLRARVINE